MKKIILDKDWYVYRREDAFSLVTSIPEDAGKTAVPYDALFHDSQEEDSRNGGRTGYFDGGVYYYQKELELPEEYAGKRLVLKAEGLFSKSFVYVNGSLEGVGMDTPFARGNLIVSLYCKLNDDGSVKNNRVGKILRQFDMEIENIVSGGYHFEYEARRFITPTTPNQTTGYSVTSLNLRWTTTSELNQEIT